MAASSFAEARSGIVAVGRWLDSKGWAPATSGNYSVRLDDSSFAVTVSGRHKGRLSEDDVMRVDASGASLDGKKPSAETALHLALYRDFPDVGAVLHSHSATAVGLTRAFPELTGWILQGHEMLKALPGNTTHETRVILPIVDNSQDMAVIDAKMSSLLVKPGSAPAYLIRAHGLYGWGKDLAEAERVIEAVEWMIAAELAEIGFRNGSAA
ncbi:methylthioribulose 1-phosphate dehydratase [Sphingomonas sp.]|uniref:methylthioribulose 1-phosphate dehydratase n=1 Tax=Sphingomonas sp. TaxID=28214 RepID=UPI003D6C9890